MAHVARKEEEEHVLNLGDSDMPKVKSDQGSMVTCTEIQLLQICAGVCWYKFLGTKLKGLEVPILVGELTGVPMTKEPGFVSNFRKGTRDSVTAEVMRVASLKKTELLRQVDDVWRKPPGLGLSSKEIKALCMGPCDEDVFYLIYAAQNWVIDSKTRKYSSDLKVMAMIRSKLDPDLSIRGRKQIPAIEHLKRSANPIAAKVAVLARRRRDHWVAQCIEEFKNAGQPGARGDIITSDEASSDEDDSKGDDDGDEEDRLVPGVTESLGSTTLSAPNLPEGLQSYPPFSSPQYAQTLWYPVSSDNPTDPSQRYLDSNINPQYSTPSQPAGQQPHSLGSDAGPDHQLPTIAGGVSERFSWDPSNQPLPDENPYTQAPAQALDRQSGFSLPQTEGEDTARVIAGYDAWAKQAFAGLNPDASSSPFSSPSEGSDQPKPQRRRLDDDGRHEKVERGGEESKKSHKHAGGSQEKAKKGREESKKGHKQAGGSQEKAKKDQGRGGKRDRRS